MSEVKELLSGIMRDECVPPEHRLHAVELLCNYYPETFQPEPPARDPVKDGVLLYGMLREAYRAGWDDSGEGWNAEYPSGENQAVDREEWKETRDRAIYELLERHNNA